MGFKRSSKKDHILDHDLTTKLRRSDREKIITSRNFSRKTIVSDYTGAKMKETDWKRRDPEEIEGELQRRERERIESIFVGGVGETPERERKGGFDA